MSGSVPLQTPSFSPIVGEQYVLAPWQSYFDSITMGYNSFAPQNNPTFTGTVTLSALKASGTAISVAGNVAFVDNVTTGAIGFNGHSAQLPQTIVGSRGASGAALNNLINALQILGLVVNGTGP